MCLKDQQPTVHQIVQTAYQDWLKKQTADVKNKPQKLYIGDKLTGSLMVKG